MGIKLLWTGLTIVVALPLLGVGAPWALIGSIVMLVGLVLVWLDK